MNKLSSNRYLMVNWNNNLLSTKAIQPYTIADNISQAIKFRCQLYRKFFSFSVSVNKTPRNSLSFPQWAYLFTERMLII